MKTLSHLTPSVFSKRKLFKYRLLAWGLALSVVPLAMVGGGIYWSHQALQQQVRQSSRQSGTAGSKLEQFSAVLQQQQQTLLVGTGVIALLTGVIALLWIHRTVERLQRLSLGPQSSQGSPTPGIVASLPENSLEPSLTGMQQANADAGWLQALMIASAALAQAESEEAVLAQVVDNLQGLLSVDRALVYRFNPDWSGTVVAEAVQPGFRSALSHTITDSCFTKPEWVEQYENGRLQRVEDVSTAALTECYLKQLEYYEVKATVAVPILLRGKLYALLIGHQCKEPRHWHNREILLCQYLALQVGAVLEQRYLQTQLVTNTQQMDHFVHLVQQFQDRLSEDSLFQTAVTEIRTALQGDRVLFYRVEEPSGGTVVAESVQPDWASVLAAEGQGERQSVYCTKARILDRHPSGQAQGIADIYATPPQEFDCSQLEQFSVEALATVPVFKSDGMLYGLLVVHQCSSPRAWQPSELHFLTQVARQVGFALDQIQHIAQTEQQSLALQHALADYTHQAKFLQKQWVTALTDSQTSLQNRTQPTAAAITTLQSWVTQIKLQAMNTTLEATRMGEAGQYFATLGETIHTLARHIETDLAVFASPASVPSPPTLESPQPLQIEQEPQPFSVVQLEDILQECQQIQAYTHQILDLAQDRTAPWGKLTIAPPLGEATPLALHHGTPQRD